MIKEFKSSRVKSSNYWATKQRKSVKILYAFSLRKKKKKKKKTQPNSEQTMQIKIETKEKNGEILSTLVGKH
jgi:hypothetical protein